MVLIKAVLSRLLSSSCQKKRESYSVSVNTQKISLTAMVSTKAFRGIAHPKELVHYRSEANTSEIYRSLQNHYGFVKTPLHYQTKEQLAVAVILSAQCTDERVNLVTKKLFKDCPDMYALDRIPLAKLEKLIFSTGFYHNKAVNLKKLARILVEKYGGEIPNDFDVLVKLPGIGRKTANVIMSVAFQKNPGIVVDTHVRRITQLLGLTGKKTPEQIEKDLMSFLPKKLWAKFPLYLIYLGREFCIANRPRCETCILNQTCLTGKRT